MAHTDGDFADFAKARWEQLHAVAAVTTGNHDRATAIVAAALGAMARAWEQVTEAGTPTADARAAVLRAALTARPVGAGAPTVFVSTGDPEVEDGGLGGEANQPPTPDDAVRAALTDVLAAVTPTARATVAVPHFWDEGLELVAGCAGETLSAIRTAHDTLLAELAAAHVDVIGAAQHPQQADTVAAALGAVLQAAAGTAPPVDVDSTVASGARPRRRTVLTVATAAAALSGAALTLAWPGTPHRTAIPPSSDAWARVATWPARGKLTADPTVSELARRNATTGARLLYAGPVGDTIAVVFATPTGTTGGPSAPESGATPPPASATVPATTTSTTARAPLFLRLFTATSASGPITLGETYLEGDTAVTAPDVVTVLVPQHDDEAPDGVLVLTRPTTTTATIRTGSTARPDGTVTPITAPLRLAGGVATTPVAIAGLPSTVTVGTWSGIPAGPSTSPPLPPDGSTAQLASAQRQLVAQLGHTAPRTLVTRVTLDALVAGTRFDPLARPGDTARVQVVTTTTPEGAVIRTVRLRTTAATDAGPETFTNFVQILAAVPARDAAIALLPAPGGESPTFIALGPPGATAQLLTFDGTAVATGSLTGGVAVLSATGTEFDAVLTMRVRNRTGATVYRGTPPTGLELLQ